MTPTSYYRLLHDMTSDRWLLSDPCGPSGEWLSTALTSGQRFGRYAELTSEMFHAGPPLEFTETSNAVPVVNLRIAEMLRARAPDDIQLIPIRVAGAPEPLWAVNILAVPDCVDEQRSVEVSRWTEEDGRPDRMGGYKSIGLLRIDPARALRHHILRPRGWTVAVVVSEALAQDLRQHDVRCELQPVS